MRQFNNPGLAMSHCYKAEGESRSWKKLRSRSRALHRLRPRRSLRLADRDQRPAPTRLINATTARAAGDDLQPMGASAKEFATAEGGSGNLFRQAPRS